MIPFYALCPMAIGQARANRSIGCHAYSTLFSAITGVEFHAEYGIRDTGYGMNNQIHCFMARPTRNRNRENLDEIEKYRYESLTMNLIKKEAQRENNT